MANLTWRCAKFGSKLGVREDPFRAPAVFRGPAREKAHGTRVHDDRDRRGRPGQGFKLYILDETGAGEESVRWWCWYGMAWGSELSARFCPHLPPAPGVERVTWRWSGVGEWDGGRESTLRPGNRHHVLGLITADGTRSTQRRGVGARRKLDRFGGAGFEPGATTACPVGLSSSRALRERTSGAGVSKAGREGGTTTGEDFTICDDGNEESIRCESETPPSSSAQSKV